MESLVFVSATQHRHAPNTYVPTHRHSAWELVYYTQGRGQTDIGGQTYSFTPRTVALIAPGVSHDESHETTCHALCVLFHVPASGLQPCVITEENDMLLTVVRRILTESRTQPAGYRDMLPLKLHELLLELRRLQQRTPRTRKSLDYAVHYLEENYCRRIRMQELAAEYGYGYDYFHHHFRAEVGCSPQQYLMRLRIQAAQALLRDSDDTCTQIAQQCGFYGSAQFSAQFRAACGCTPMAWRAAIKSVLTGQTPSADPSTHPTAPPEKY